MKRTGNNRAMVASKAQMPEGWRLVRLGDVVRFKQGGTPSKARPEFWDGEIPFVTGADLRETRISRDNARSFLTNEGLHSGATAICKEGALLLATRTRVGLVGIAAEMMGASQDITLLAPTDAADQSYLYRTLLNNADLLQQRSRGTTIQGVSREDIDSLPILLPPLTEQQAIATVLDSIDDAIEGAEAVIAATEQLRDSLLHQLLTRGVPGWHTEWKDVPGLGTMPADWEVVRLGEVAMVRNGTTPSRKNMDYWDSGCIPFVKTGRVNDIFIQEPDEFITPKAVTDSGVVVIPEGSVLIAMIGQGKTRGMTAKLGFRAAINQNFAAVFEPRQGFTLDFFFAWASHNYALIRSLGQGSNQDALNCELIQRMLIPFPSKPEQRAITRPLAGVDAALARARYEEKCLQGLKDSTADAVLTGRVRVHQPK